MSNNNELEALVKVLLASQNNNNNSNEGTGNQSKNSWMLPIGIAILPILVTLFGVFYNTGVRTEELSGGIEKVSLEMKAEFTQSLADHKDYINKEFRDLQSEVKEVIRDNHQMKMSNGQMEKRIDELEDENKDLKRTSNEHYRTLQYLKSQSNINIPPN